MLSGKQSKKKEFRSKLLKEFLIFLRGHQCVSEATIVIRRNFIIPFLSKIKGIASPSKLHKLSPKTIHDYVIKTSKPLHRASRKHLTSSLRSFLRFSYIWGYLKKNLVEVVPVIATRKLDRTPTGISWDEVQKLLAAPDRRRPTGRRDYAILLLLVTYGVRIGQVTNLKLQDIRWHEGIVHFKPSKGGRPLSFPLEKRVAKALLEYIKKDRRGVSFQELFLTVKGPQRPLSPHNHLGTSLRVYYKHAGINSKTQGSRVIRHAFATRLMENRIPIKTISDLLGHRCIDNTFIYTKVDTEGLRILARKWPEVIL